MDEPHFNMFLQLIELPSALKSRMEQTDPNRAKFLTEKLDPVFTYSKTDRLPPKRTNSRTERAEPICAKPKILKTSPKRAVRPILQQDPNLENARRDILEPVATKSMADTELPRRMKERVDKEDAIFTRFKIETDVCNRTFATTDKEEPTLATDLNETVEPIDIKSNTEIADPNRPNERNEKELLKCTKFNTESEFTLPMFT
jgi:hypothetical protein